MTFNEAQMRSYYAARANEYDAVYLKAERQADLRAVERWLPPRFAGATVLEVACGTGYWTQFIATAATRVVALDTSPETMDIARARVPAGAVEFQVGDAYRLAPALGKFGAAFAGFWFSHVPTRRRHEFLQGLDAMLVPGARVVVLDNRYVAGSSTPIAESDADGNTYQTRTLKDGSTHRVLKNFPTEAELQAAVAGVGEAGRFTTWQYFWAFDYVANGSAKMTNSLPLSTAQTMRPTTTIRALREQDYQAWLPLWDGYNAFYGREGATALDPEITRTTWHRFFEPAEPVFALVAESEGKLVGLAHYLYHRSTTRIELTGYLQDLFTLPAARGRGVGRALIEAVYREARASGIKRVYWQTQHSNAAGRLLYDKVATHLGFIVYSHEV